MLSVAARTNPHQLEAMELRDQLQDRRSWDEEASAVRHLLYDLITEESGGPKPDFGRPAPPFKIPEGFEGPAGTEDNEPDSGNESGEATSPPTEVGKP